MRKFDYYNCPNRLLTAEVVRLLNCLYEFRGKQAILVDFIKSEVLDELLQIAMVQSIEGSNKIEGIHVSTARFQELINGKRDPISQGEQELMGYRQVLKRIQEDYSHITLSQEHILQFHRDLFSLTNKLHKGEYKTQDGIVVRYNSSGNLGVRFATMPHYFTKIAVEELVSAFNEAMSRKEYDSLILIPMFMVDFLCIHPFQEGNGQLSRLLATLLLYKSGHFAGKYISIEHIIEESRDAYYEALYRSSISWLEGKNDYLPFVKYFLTVLYQTCNEFDKRLSLVKNSGGKGKRIKEWINQKTGHFTKQEILEFCPDVSKSTVTTVLRGLVEDGYIEKCGSGQGTQYVRRSV